MVKPKLTPRMVEVVILVGKERLSYKAAARQMEISHHTVREYAREIRDMIGTTLSPRDALTAFYWRHAEEL